MLLSVSSSLCLFPVELIKPRERIVIMWFSSCVLVLVLTIFHFKTNRRAIAMMFVRLSGTGVHCDHTMHVGVDLSLWLDSTICRHWAPWHQTMSSYSQPSFSSSIWKRGGVWMCKLDVISEEWLKRLSYR